MRTRDTRRERGVAFVATLVMLVLLAGLGAALHVGTLGETTLRGAHARSTAGFYAAEAGINRGMGEYRNIFLAYGVPTGPDFAARSFLLGPRTVHYQLSSVPGNPRQVTVPAGRPFAGLNSIEYRYTAASRSEVRAGDVEATLGTEFDVDYVPLFQFLAFYAGDLEILPGANMLLHGPVYTNGDLYLNSDATLTIADLPPTMPTVHVSTARSVIRGRKNAAVCGGTVRIAKLVDANHDGALDLRTMPCAGTQTSAQLAAWLGAIRASEPAVSVPTPDIIARGAGAFWQRADLRIVLDLDAADANGRYPIVAQQASGAVDAARTARLQAFMTERPGRLFYTDVPRAGSDAATPCADGDSYCNPQSYVPPFAAASAVHACAGSDLGLWGGCAATVANENLSGGGVTARRGGFYNNRELAWVHLLNVNVHDLLAWNRTQAPGDQLFDPDDTSDGGLVLFLSVAGPGAGGVGTPRYGVRVLGSPDLDFPAGAADPTGLTVVSDQAAYAEGHYNVGTGGFPKQPAAILGDTVNVLSGGWSGAGACRNDCQSRRPLNERPAASTTLNAAFIAGVDITTLGNYNGGLENYPRFHEVWTGQALDYRGSFVSLGTPRHANGPWCGTGAGCNIYSPPLRNWDYDTDFQDAANLPPLTPRFVSVQQIIFTENFR